MDRRYLCILACTIILFSGCGGDNDESSRGKQGSHAVDRPFAGKLLEPCELITATEAQSLTGESVKEGKHDEQPAVGMKKCLYETADADSSKFLHITVLQPESMPEAVRKTGQTPKTVFTETRKLLSDGCVDLNGFGDEAFISVGGLHMLTGKYYVTIGTGNTNRDEIRGQLEAAGRLVLNNLQRR